MTTKYDIDVLVQVVGEGEMTLHCVGECNSSRYDICQVELMNHINGGIYICRCRYDVCETLMSVASGSSDTTLVVTAHGDDYVLKLCVLKTDGRGSEGRKTITLILEQEY